MIKSSTERRTDIAFAVVLIAIGTVAVAMGLRIPASRFDPLGSGAVPALMGAVLLVLALALLAAATTRLRIGDGDRLFTGLDGADTTTAPLRAAAAFAWTLAYAGTLHLRVLPYWASTFVFVFALAIALAPPRRRGYAMAAIVAAVLGAGLDVIFRRVLSVDLP